MLPPPWSLSFRERPAKIMSRRNAHCSRLRAPSSSALLLALLPLLFIAPVHEARADSSSLAELTIEELMDITVVSPSKKSERIATTAAAVYVVTADDIRRTGAKNVPEALRNVPGVQVAQIDNSRWAISIRGPNGLFVDKVLVLIDGRSIYIPLFAGVYWDEQDLPLEDVDRIEVIRGPGGPLWGANAVNGVINIITKTAMQTEGVLVTGGVGSEQRAESMIRYGATLSDSTSVRAYAKYYERDDGEGIDGADANDANSGLRGGFRSDTRLDDGGRFTLSGDVNYVDEQLEVKTPMLHPPFTEQRRSRKRATEGNLLARLSVPGAGDDELQIQFYTDLIDRTDVVEQQLFVTDVDMQYRFRPAPGHDLVSGMGYRFSYDELLPSEFASLSDETRALNRGTAFVQDEITLVPDTLYLIFGTKLELYEEASAELQPNARLRYSPSRRTTLWTAVSRAVGTPSRSEEELRLLVDSSTTPEGVPVIVSLNGRNTEEVESLIAIEAGGRQQLWSNLSLDLTGFYNIYDDVQSFEPAAPSIVDAHPPFILQPLFYDHLMRFNAWGSELAVVYEPAAWWTVRGSATWLNIDRNPRPSSRDILSGANDAFPHFMFGLRSSVDLTDDIEFDTMLRYVDRLEGIDAAEYAELDLRIGWQASEQLRLSLSGQNLLHDSHSEFRENLVSLAPIDVERSIFLKAEWSW